MENTMPGFVDEIVKIAGAGDIASFLAKHWKIPTAVAGGALALHTGQKTKRRYEIGKAYEEQMEARGG